MALYDFTAIDAHGRCQRGCYEAGNEREVREWLRRRSWAPLQVTSSSALRGWWLRLRANRHRQLALGRRGTLLFTQQLSVMLQAGLTLESALQIIARSTTTAAGRQVVEGLRHKLQEGHSFAAALRDYPRSFPPLYCALVAAGERGAGLETVLSGLLAHLHSDAELRSKALAATVYPVLLVVVCAAIVLALLTFIVPTVVELFVQGGQSLPLPTRILLAVSSGMERWGIGVLMALAALAVAAKILSQFAAVAPYYHRAQLWIPLLGYWRKAAAAERYLRTLGTLVQAGVPLQQGLSVARKVVGNRFIEQQLTLLEQRVAEGQPLSALLPNSGLFSPFVIALVASAEQSGTLGQQLLHAAAQQQREISARLSWLLALLEPAMLLLMGAIVLFVVAAILLPIFNLNQLLPQ